MSYNVIHFGYRSKAVLCGTIVSAAVCVCFEQTHSVSSLFTIKNKCKMPLL